MIGKARSFRLLIILVPIIALALGSFWLLEVMRRAMSDFVPETVRTKPDFYVDEFNYVKMSTTGLPQYHFSGTRLTHNPQDDSYDVQRPLVTGLSNPEVPTTLRSERAHVNSDGSEVRMYDKAQMDRPGSANNEPLRVKSEYLQLLPDDDIVRTDRPAVITLGASILTGTGMYANNATRAFRLMSNVHGTYQPPPR